MLQIVVYGYYRRSNCGDDQYEETITKFIDTCALDHMITFISPDQRLPTCDMIIVGGGDVLNTWFLVPLIEALNKLDKKPLTICLSVGLPYPNIIDEGHLDIFDRFFVRSHADISRLSEKYGAKNVKYLPDMSVLLSCPIYHMFQEGQYEKPHAITRGKLVKHIAICLARPIYHSTREKEYRSILKSLAKGIVNTDFVRSSPYPLTFHLIAFNQDLTNEQENDFVINQDFEQILKKKLSKRRLPHVIVNEVNLKHHRDVFELIGQMDLAITMRFHSIWFSLLQGVPFLPIYSTRKVHNLLKHELGYSLGIQMPTDQRLVPTSLNADDVRQNLNYLYLSGPLLLNKMTSCVQEMARAYCDSLYYFQRLFKVTDIPKRVVMSELSQTEFLEGRFTAWLMKKRNIEHLSSWKEISDMTDEEAKFGTTLFLMGTLRLPNPESTPYFYGLFEKIKCSTASINLAEDLSWVQMENRKQSVSQPDNPFLDVDPSLPRPLINMSFIPQRSNGKYHRFGWTYCMDIMEQINDPNSDLLMDVYLDRTFGWNAQYLETMGVLPYSRPWVGFIHHTFLAGYSTNNCFALVKEPLFVESLKHCKGLFVLSKALERQLRHAMILLDLPPVPIHTLHHPTGFVDNTFDWNRFMASEQKKLIHVGAWMRDTFSFYKLDVSTTPFEKHALLGKDMDGYFDKAVCAERYFYCEVLQRPPRTTPKETGFLKKLFDCMKRLLGRKTPRNNNEDLSVQSFLFEAICRDDKPISTDCMCRAICRDIWTDIEASEYREQIMALIEQVEGQETTVQFIRELDDPDYDDLLSTSVIFLRLFDASAVNTVIEAIVRNTPIIVNRIPALVEYLGSNYPLFYDTLEEVPRLLDYGVLREGHLYLANMDKSFLTAPNFFSQLVAILSNI